MTDNAIDKATNHGLDAIKALWERNEVARVGTLLRELNARQPEREDVAMFLAEVLRSQGRLSAASEVVLQFCRANEFEPDPCSRAAEFARQCDRHAIATEICRQTLIRNPDPPADLLVLAAHVARESGDFATARVRYLAALGAGVDLERNYILGALANTQRYANPADPDMARCRRHFRDSARSTRSRASAGFGLGKILDDLGEHESAAGVLREANAMLRAAQPWNATAWNGFVGARLRERVAAIPSGTVTDLVPVFMVGVPRSGTTLATTLLARATGARDRGELRTLRFIADQLAAGGYLGSGSALAEAADLYRRLAVQDDAPATWYLDQDPLNFRWLDIAAAMFPQARVIHLRRDPRDTALSLWSQEFAHADMGFSSDFADIAAFMHGHDALMAHWRRTLRIPIHELDYEALVSDPDGSIANLSRLIGASVRERATGDDAAPVQSASVWQARQPVYRTSVGRWRHYAPHVPELERFGGFK
jgi:tetratricopeptide (TPR) repeat protein